MPASPTNPLPALPDDLAPLLALLRRDDLALTDIARHYNVSPDAFALWLTAPDVREALESTDSLAATRTRMIASDRLPRVLATLDTILQVYIHAHRDPQDAAAEPPQTPVSGTVRAHAAPDQRIPTHETARRAAGTIFRLANYTVPPPKSLSRQREEQPAASVQSAQHFSAPVPANQSARAPEPQPPAAHPAIPEPDEATLDAVLDFLTQEPDRDKRHASIESLVKVLIPDHPPAAPAAPNFHNRPTALPKIPTLSRAANHTSPAAFLHAKAGELARAP